MATKGSSRQTASRSTQNGTVTSFAQVQQVVEACGRTRHELAREAKVSTKTIQRILAGTVPTLESRPETNPVSKREYRLWARSLTKLAQYFGHEPKPWLEAAKIPIERELQTLVRQSQDDDEVFASIEGSGRVRVCLSTNPPFHEAGSTDSFFYQYITSLIRGINREWRVDPPMDWTATSSPPQYDYKPVLYGPKDHHVLVGLMETVHRSQERIDFVQIPGWRISLSALWYSGDKRSKPSNRPKPKWDEIVTDATTRPEKKQFEAVVVRDEVGHDFLEGPCQYGTGQLHIQNSTDPELTAQTLICLQDERDRKGTGTTVVFVADEETCRQVIQTRPGKLEEIDVSSNENDNELPTYSLSLAIRASAWKWKDYLEKAQCEVLFDSMLDQTARLYANVLRTGLGLAGVGGITSPVRTNWKLVHFDLANTSFQRKLCEYLLQGLLDRFQNAPEIAIDWLCKLTPRRWAKAIIEAVCNVEPSDTILAALVKNPPPKWKDSLSKAFEKQAPDSKKQVETLLLQTTPANKKVEMLKRLLGGRGPQFPEDLIKDVIMNKLRVRNKSILHPQITAIAQEIKGLRKELRQLTHLLQAKSTDITEARDNQVAPSSEVPARASTH